MQEPWVASRSTLPALLGWQTMVARKTQVGSSRPTPFLPPVVAGAEDGGVTGGRQGLHRIASAFTSVAAEAQPRHNELSSETGILPDPLTLHPDTTHGRDITEDPMLEEFVASLTSSRIVAWPSLELQDEAPTVMAP